MATDRHAAAEQAHNDKADSRVQCHQFPHRFRHDVSRPAPSKIGFRSASRPGCLSPGRCVEATGSNPLLHKAMSMLRCKVVQATGVGRAGMIFRPGRIESVANGQPETGLRQFELRQGCQQNQRTGLFTCSCCCRRDSRLMQSVRDKMPQAAEPDCCTGSILPGGLSTAPVRMRFGVHVARMLHLQRRNRIQQLRCRFCIGGDFAT